MNEGPERDTGNVREHKESFAPLTLGYRVYARHVNFPSDSPVGAGIASRMAWFDVDNRLPLVRRILQRSGGSGPSRSLPSLHWLQDLTAARRKTIARSPAPLGANRISKSSDAPAGSAHLQESSAASTPGPAESLSTANRTMSNDSTASSKLSPAGGDPTVTKEAAVVAHRKSFVSRSAGLTGDAAIHPAAGSISAGTMPLTSRKLMPPILLSETRKSANADNVQSTIMQSQVARTRNSISRIASGAQAQERPAPQSAPQNHNIQFSHETVTDALGAVMPKGRGAEPVTVQPATVEGPEPVVKANLDFKPVAEAKASPMRATEAGGIVPTLGPPILRRSRQPGSRPTAAGKVFHSIKELRTLPSSADRTFHTEQPHPSPAAMLDSVPQTSGAVAPKPPITADGLTAAGTPLPQTPPASNAGIFEHAVGLASTQAPATVIHPQLVYRASEGNATNKDGGSPSPQSASPPLESASVHPGIQRSLETSSSIAANSPVPQAPLNRVSRSSSLQPASQPLDSASGLPVIQSPASTAGRMMASLPMEQAHLTAPQIRPNIRKDTSKDSPSQLLAKTFAEKPSISRVADAPGTTAPDRSTLRAAETEPAIVRSVDLTPLGSSPHDKISSPSIHAPTAGSLTFRSQSSTAALSHERIQSAAESGEQTSGQEITHLIAHTSSASAAPSISSGSEDRGRVHGNTDAETAMDATPAVAARQVETTLIQDHSNLFTPVWRSSQERSFDHPERGGRGNASARFHNSSEPRGPNSIRGARYGEAPSVNT